METGNEQASKAEQNSSTLKTAKNVLKKRKNKKKGKAGTTQRVKAQIEKALWQKGAKQQHSKLYNDLATKGEMRRLLKLPTQLTNMSSR